MANIQELNLDGFISLFTAELKRQPSTSQFLIGNVTDLKTQLDYKILKYLGILLNPATLVDSIQKQLTDIIAKAKLNSYYGPVKFVDQLTEETKKAILFGSNDGMMNDIISTSITAKFKNLTHLGLWTVAVEFELFKLILESPIISTLEVQNVQILNVIPDTKITFAKETLVWLATNDLDVLVNEFSVMGAAKHLRTDNFNVLACLKGHIKTLVTLDISIAPANTRHLAKSLLFAKNLVEGTFKCIGANKEQTRMIFNAIDSDKIEKLVLIPSLYDLEIKDLEKFEQLSCFGAVLLPFPLIKTVKLTSIFLHTVNDFQYAQLNTTIQSYQIKHVYFTGIPNEINQFQQEYHEQLLAQGCKIHIVNK